MKKIQNIIILAGGDSTRFWPLKEKNLLSFTGKPFIQHVVDAFRPYGETIHVVVSAKNREDIIKVLPSEIHYIKQDKTLPGMGGAMMSCRGKLKGEVLIVNANDIFDFTFLTSFIERIRLGHEDIVLTAKKISTYFPGGYLQLKEEKLVGIIEKPGPDKIPSPFVRLTVDYFSDVSLFIEGLEKVKTDSDDWYEKALTHCIQKGNAGYIEYDKWWHTIKYPWHVLPMMEFFLKQMDRKVYVGKNVRISNLAKVVGPTYIGDNTVVGDFALVRQCNIGKNCLIGSFSEIARSYIGDNVSLHRNYVGDSVLGNKVLCGAGAITANFRFDERSVWSVVSGTKIDTGLNKCGAIVGEDSKIGVNATLTPGVKIGHHSFVGPGEVIDADVKDNMFIYNNKSVKNIL